MKKNKVTHMKGSKHLFSKIAGAVGKHRALKKNFADEYVK